MDNELSLCVFISLVVGYRMAGWQIVSITYLQESKEEEQAELLLFIYCSVSCSVI